jgi:hypothetical protein
MSPERIQSSGDEEKRLRAEWERLAGFVLAAENSAKHPGRSTLLWEQLELQRTLQQVRAEYKPRHDPCNPQLLSNLERQPLGELRPILQGQPLPQ